ncbi:MAG TPA: acyltransferase, partial [Usitatibacter sp.]
MRIAELDALRGVAILAVFAVHSHPGIVGGWLSIDLFFVLSGYLITGALERDGSLARFYRRRAARIIPPLAATVALAYAIAPGFKLEPLAYFYGNFVPAESLGSLAHTWYLSVEEQFYLLWPAAFLLKRRNAVLAIVICLAWAFHVWMAVNGTDLDSIHRSTFSRMDALAVGCALALFRPPVGKVVGNAAYALVVLSLFTADFAPITVAVGLALFPIVCAGVVRAAPQIAFLRLPGLAYFGERAWGLYLYHYPIFCALAPLQDPTRKTEWMAIAVAKIVLSIAVAELSYRTIERWSAD